jgi:hypothetical protein
MTIRQIAQFTKIAAIAMPEFPHDTFAKDYLTELLSTIGTAVPMVLQSERCRRLRKIFGAALGFVGPGFRGCIDCLSWIERD